MSKFVAEILEDGTVKADSSKLAGSEQQIRDMLEEIARETGGELVVEKHVHRHGQHVATDNRQKAGQK
jgi:hypothetical protein